MAKKHYDSLGVDENSTSEEIKKAFKKKASKLHPDKGGDKEEFQAVQKAYQVLRNPDTRARYDETGDDREPESRQSRVVAQLIEGFLAIIEEADIARCDLVEEMRVKIKGTIAANRRLEKEYRGKAQRYEKARTRILLRKKNVPNIFDNALRARVERMEAQVRAVQSQIEDLESMTEILKDFYCDTPSKDFGFLSPEERWVMREFGIGQR